MRRSLLALFVGIAFASSVQADDWPQFRGPDRSGVSKETGLLKEWPKDGPKLAWIFKNAGLGCSSVAVVKGIVYTLGTDYDPKMPNAPAFDPKLPKAGALKEYVIAIDEKNGMELWRHGIGPLSTFAKPFNAYGDGPRSTPTIDGNFLYALGGNGQLVCFDIAKKKEVWRKNLITDLGGVMGKYGYSESPLIDGDKLICSPGGPQGTLAALDKSSGAVVWRSKGLTNLVNYSSMVAADIHGVRQYIQTSYVSKPGDIHGELSGVDTKGNLLWTATISTGENEGSAASPIVSGNTVYVTVGWGAGCHLFDISAKQVATDLYNKKKSKGVKNTHGGVVLIDGHIYGHSERDSWVCQNLKKGDVRWEEAGELPCHSGTVAAADGKLYLFTEDGEVGLVNADPSEFKLISSFKLPVQSTIPRDRITSRNAKAWAYPVIANGHLYLRDHEYIFAFKITK